MQTAELTPMAMATARPSMWSAAIDHSVSIVMSWHGSRRMIRTPRSPATRSTDLVRIYGGGKADQLPARGELGAHIMNLVESRRVTFVTGFHITALHKENNQIVVEGDSADGLRQTWLVDRIIAATGQRPDLSLDARTASGPRSVAGEQQGAWSPDRSEPAFLWNSAATRASRAEPSGAKFLHSRHQSLRPRANVFVADRL